MRQNLKGKVAVVTGAGRGIGRGIALLLAEQGAAVVVNDLGCEVDGSGNESRVADQVVAEIRAAGGLAVANGDSVTDFAASEQIVETARQEFGRLDILVNNAGILRDRMIFNMSEAEWDAVIAVHLKGTWNCTRHATRRMKEEQNGRIISLTSTSGLYGNPGQANYGAAKDAIAGMTRVVAREVGKYGITVNAIAPAAHTRMISSIPKAASDKKAAAGIATPRLGPRPLFGEADDIAPMIGYLATDAARDVNGQIFMVTAGLISRLSDPTPSRTITRPERWTPEEIAMVFSRTLGLDIPNPMPARPKAD